MVDTLTPEERATLSNLRAYMRMQLLAETAELRELHGHLSKLVDEQGPATPHGVEILE